MTSVHVLGRITLLDRRNVLHAADQDGAQFDLIGISKRRAGRPPRRTLATACGMQRVAPYMVRISFTDGRTDAQTMLWPPRVSVAESFGFTRCRGCFEATGRPRPDAGWNDLRDIEAVA